MNDDKIPGKSLSMQINSVFVLVKSLFGLLP